MNFSTLLTCEVVAGHLNDPEWRVFDCRHRLSDVEFGAQAYADGHLPGAYFLHLDRDLSAPTNGRNGRHPLPDAQLLASKLGAAGVSRQTQVVAYDDDGGMIAARLWWLLRWLGHDRVALLDGGIGQWVREGRALTSERPKPVPAVFEVERRDWVVSSDEVLASLDHRELCLVDARSPDRFRGENETLDPVGGHIPGARNRFFRDNLDAEGCFRPASELRREFLALLAGVDPAQSVMQCGSGVTACHNLLAMEIAGLHGAKLHAGSWSEWCADPDRPVAR
jgi:thiosulfate/3-mercaptopyruvate sulfurtransferase